MAFLALLRNRIEDRRKLEALWEERDRKKKESAVEKQQDGRGAGTMPLEQPLQLLAYFRGKEGLLASQLGQRLNRTTRIALQVSDEVQATPVAPIARPQMGNEPIDVAPKGEDSPRHRTPASQRRENLKSSLYVPVPPTLLRKAHQTTAKGVGGIRPQSAPSSTKPSQTRSEEVQESDASTSDSEGLSQFLNTLTPERIGAMSTDPNRRKKKSTERSDQGNAAPVPVQSHLEYQTSSARAECSQPSTDMPSMKSRRDRRSFGEPLTDHPLTAVKEEKEVKEVKEQRTPKPAPTPPVELREVPVTPVAPTPPITLYQFDEEATDSSEALVEEYVSPIRQRLVELELEAEEKLRIAETIRKHESLVFSHYSDHVAQRARMAAMLAAVEAVEAADAKQVDDERTTTRKKQRSSKRESLSPARLGLKTPSRYDHSIRPPFVEARSSLPTARSKPYMMKVAVDSGKACHEAAKMQAVHSRRIGKREPHYSFLRVFQTLQPNSSSTDSDL